MDLMITTTIDFLWPNSKVHLVNLLNVTCVVMCVLIKIMEFFKNLSIASKIIVRYKHIERNHMTTILLVRLIYHYVNEIDETNFLNFQETDCLHEKFIKPEIA